MKMTGTINYDVEDVFNHFIKNAKRDFSDFNEENPVGCKIEKDITTGGPKPIRCTVEITDYEKNGKYEITIYTSCCNLDKGIYYYTTYNNHQISAVDMHRENLDSDKLVRYPIILNQNINFQN